MTQTIDLGLIKGEPGFGVPKPGLSDVGKIPVVNSSGNGYELANINIKSDSQFRLLIDHTLSENIAQFTQDLDAAYTEIWAILQDIQLSDTSTDDSTSFRFCTNTAANNELKKTSKSNILIHLCCISGVQVMDYSNHGTYSVNTATSDFARSTRENQGLINQIVFAPSYPSNNSLQAGARIRIFGR